MRRSNETRASRLTYHLHTDHAVKRVMLELIILHVPGDNPQIRKPLLLRSLIDMNLLRPAIAERSDLRVWKHLRQIQTHRAPSASTQH